MATVILRVLGWQLLDWATSTHHLCARLALLRPGLNFQVFASVSLMRAHFSLAGSVGLCAIVESKTQIHGAVETEATAGAAAETARRRSRRRRLKIYARR